MSKDHRETDFSDDYDWDADNDFDDRESDKAKASANKVSRKRSIKRRLDDYFEGKQLREKNRSLDYFDELYSSDY